MPSIADLQSLGNAPPLHATSTGATQGEGILEDYLLWVRSRKKATCNVSQLLEETIPGDSGKKGKGKRKK